MSNSNFRNTKADDQAGLNSFRNYITNAGSDQNTNGWATYADAAGTTPVDGTGGSASITWTRTTSNPLNLDGSFQFAKSAVNLQGNGVSYDFTIARSDQARVMQIEFDYEIVSGTFAGSATVGTNSDVTVWIYDVTNAQLIQPAGSLLDGSLNSTQYRYRGTFQTNSNSQSYRLILHTTTTSATAYSINFDNFRLGRQVVSTGVAMTDWVSYTPTFTGFGTPSNVSYRWRRVGANLEVEGHMTLGTTTSVTAQVSLPSGLTIDSSVSNGETVGIGGQNTANNRAFFVMATGGNTFVTFAIISSTTTSTTSVLGTAMGATGEYQTYKWEVPIVGWSSNVQVSSDTDTRVVAVAQNFALPTGTLNSSFNVVKFGSVTYDTHGAYNTSTGVYTIPVAGYYRIAACIEINANATAGSTIKLSARVNGTGLVDGCSVGQASITGLISDTYLVGTVFCKAGDTLDIAVAVSGASPVYSTGNVGSSFAIERVSGPAQVAASESVNMRYTNTAGTTINTSATVLPYGNKIFDSHSAYNTTTGLYTVPVSGKYQVNARYTTAGIVLATTNSYNIRIYKNGAEYDRQLVIGNGASVNWQPSIGTIVDCLAGDTIGVYADGNSSTTTVLTGQASMSTFTLTRVGN